MGRIIRFRLIFGAVNKKNQEHPISVAGKKESYKMKKTKNDF